MLQIHNILQQYHIYLVSKLSCCPNRKLQHSKIFFFSHPSSVFTHTSPGDRQSFDINGILKIQNNQL